MASIIPHKQRHTLLQSQLPRSPQQQETTLHTGIGLGLVLQFSSTSSLLSFQKTYHKLISSIKRVFLLSKIQEITEAGRCQSRTWDCCLSFFLPEHKTQLVKSRCLNTQTTAKAKDETETGQEQHCFKTIFLQTDFLTRG